MAELRFEDLSFSYVGRHKEATPVFEKLSAAFPLGEINVILGYSGCGKTTLLRCIAGTLEYSGHVYLKGKPLEELTVPERNFSYVGQDAVLYSSMTVYENIVFPLLMKKVPKEEAAQKARDLAYELGIEDCLNVKGKYLSLGQQQRAMLAREIVSRPSLLLMDEPFTALDAPLRDSLDRLVKDLAKKQRSTVLYVTHSYQEAFLLADNLFLMEEGRFIAIGTPEELLNEKNPYLDEMIRADRYEVKHEEKKD